MKEQVKAASSKSRGHGKTWESGFSKTAFMISLLSLIAVLYQSYLGREENKLIRKQQEASVMPYLSAWQNYQNGTFEFVIANQGVGPAFIEQVSFQTRDSTGKDTLTFHNSDHFIHHLQQRYAIFDSLAITTSTIARGHLLPALKQVPMVHVEDANALLLKRFVDIFYESIVAYNIHYKDVYGTRWKLRSEMQIPILIE